MQESAIWYPKICTKITRIHLIFEKFIFKNPVLTQKFGGFSTLIKINTYAQLESYLFIHLLHIGNL